MPASNLFKCHVLYSSILFKCSAGVCNPPSKSSALADATFTPPHHPLRPSPLSPSRQLCTRRGLLPPCTKSTPSFVTSAAMVKLITAPVISCIMSVNPAWPLFDGGLYGGKCHCATALSFLCVVTFAVGQVGFPPFNLDGANNPASLTEIGNC